MQVCLLIDTLGVGKSLQIAAQSTWARKGEHVGAVWFVHNSDTDPLQQPGHVNVSGSHMWVHQPVVNLAGDDPWNPKHGPEFADLNASWPVSHDWALNRQLETIIWHVQRRWRMLTSAAVLDRMLPRPEAIAPSCSWVGYFRADSFANIPAIIAALEHESQQIPPEEDQPVPLIFGRAMKPETQGSIAPLIRWNDADIGAAWSSSGLLLNRAAVEIMAGAVREGELRTEHVTTVARWLAQDPSLGETLAGQREMDGDIVGRLELVFAGSMRAQHRRLFIRWLPRPRDQFLVGDALLQRFVFRLGAATFGWSDVDLREAGLGSPAGLGRRALLPQCILSFYPVRTAATQRAIHGLVKRVACVPSMHLSRGSPHGHGARGTRIAARGALGRMRVWSAGGSLFTSQTGRARPVLAVRSPEWSSALRGNRRAWASLIAGPRQPCIGSCPVNSSRSFRFAPTVGKSFALQESPPPFMHDDEWVFSPAGHVELRTTMTIVAALPNGASTWFLQVLEHAQQTTHGTVATMWDALHPFCNIGASADLGKVMGAPEDRTWPHIFRKVSPAALDTIFDILSTQFHNKALRELQFMRQHGATITGEVVHPIFRWPWLGVVPRRMDALRIRLIASKEIVNVFQLVQFAESRLASGALPGVAVVSLYRHRAHSFPMSNETQWQWTVCKWCMFERIVRSFLTNRFSQDEPLRGLQQWWNKQSVGGLSTPGGQVFGHLLVWYVVLRSYATRGYVLDFAQLMLMTRHQLRTYLNSTLPSPLKHQPGVAALARSIELRRFSNPQAFLERREQMYSDLGIEPFARSVIAEMRRLDPATDVSILEQLPRG